jgi:hypothetical protein
MNCLVVSATWDVQNSDDLLMIEDLLWQLLR